MPTVPATRGPTDPGPRRLTNDAAMQEYDRGYSHGYIAGLRACPQAPPHGQGKPCSSPSTDDGFQRFLFGLALGFIPALVLGLFLGLLLAVLFKT